MTWEPRAAMSRLQYVRFKLGLWAQADSLPDWVKESRPSYQSGRSMAEKGVADGREYRVHERNYYKGDSLIYCTRVGAAGGVSGLFVRKRRPFE